MDQNYTYSAFLGTVLLESGTLRSVLRALKARSIQSDSGNCLVFVDQTGEQIDFDLRGTLPQVIARYSPAAPRAGPGRPKLGVVAREVSLLPRHWEWLEQQPSGASAAIRRLVEKARKNVSQEQQARATIDAVSRFLTSMAGNLPGYEEACRALYARNREHLNRQIKKWPRDVRRHVLRLTQNVF